MLLHSKKQLLKLLEELKLNGKKVVGYAATSKSTTILNYCGISTNLIEHIYDKRKALSNNITESNKMPQNAKSLDHPYFKIPQCSRHLYMLNLEK